jgi:Polysaccharide deacetylase
VFQTPPGIVRETGHFVISLDFELHWGLRDHTTVEEYRPNLLGVWTAIPKLLELFEARKIRATWAVVGLLMAKDKDELLGSLPSVRPQYRDSALDPYRALDRIGRSEEDDPFHYAPSLVAEIARTPGQEIGTHTFSHLYALEDGVELDAFVADLNAANAMMIRRGLPTATSLVFPRNQYGADHVRALPGCGITAFRGHAFGRFQEPRPGSGEHLGRKFARLVDAYVPLARDAQHARRPPGLSLVDLPASRFLRPWSAARAGLDPLRLRRITQSMTTAARAGADFHLWWHPHNFGKDLTLNLDFLNRVLDHFHTLRSQYGIRSAHMADRAASLGL